MPSEQGITEQHSDDTAGLGLEDNGNGCPAYINTLVKIRF